MKACLTFCLLLSACDSFESVRVGVAYDHDGRRYESYLEAKLRHSGKEPARITPTK